MAVTRVYSQFTGFSHISKGKKYFCSITCKLISEVKEWVVITSIISEPVIWRKAVFEAHLHHSVHMYRSHGNRTHVPQLMVDYFMSRDCSGTCCINEGRREEQEGEEGLTEVKWGERDRRQRRGSSEALVCFHQLNCNHTVWVSLAPLGNRC